MGPDTIECVECEGWGHPADNSADDCTHCKGEGWRERTPDETDAAAEAQHEERCTGEPPITLDETHARAWTQHQELHS